MKKQRLGILVIGLGRFGSALANRLVELRQHVVGVDRVRARVEEMADRLDLAAQLDATDEDALIKVGAKEMDLAVIAIGEGVEASVLATAILKDLGVPRIVARAISPLHGRVLSRVGADQIVSPERDMGLRMAELVLSPWLARFSCIDEGDLLVGEIEPLPEMCGRRLEELQFTRRYGATILMVEREGKRILPRADTELLEGDRLWIAGKRDDLAGWAAEAVEP
jgi:trk system potassium uptake protein TrkA